MKNLEFEEIYAYDFTEEYKKNRVLAVKKRFIEMCRKDNTLSAEFKAHISNMENINVSLQSMFGYEFRAEFCNLSIEYCYDYTYTYSYGSHLAGEVSYDTSTGKADTSGLRVVKEYATNSSTFKGSWLFCATKMTPCFMTFGSAKFKEENLKNYKRIIDVSKASTKLQYLMVKPFTYQDINRHLRVDDIPGSVYNAIKEEIMGRKSESERPRNFQICSIKDYGIDEISVILFPYACNFDIYINYKGKEYKQLGITEIDKITSFGETSNHFQQYQKLEERARITYNSRHWPRRKIHLAAAMLALFAFITIGVLFGISTFVKREELFYMHWWKIALMLAGTLLLFILSLVYRSATYEIDIPQNIYSPNKELKHLQVDLSVTCLKQQSKTTKSAAFWLAFLMFVVSGLGVIMGRLYKTTYKENYLYTPEVVQTYTGSINMGIFSGERAIRYTILSCDENGNIDLIVEYKQGTLYAKFQYSGQIIEKHFMKKRIRCKLVEEIENNGKYPIEDEKEIYLQFTDFKYREMYVFVGESQLCGLRAE